MTKIAQSLAIAAAMLAVSFAIASGVMVGTLGADVPVRAMMIVNALLLAYYGNAIPKAVLPTATARAAKRFAGWVFVLAGLSSAALWSLAPIDIATPASLAIIASAVALAFGYCLVNRTTTATLN